MQNPKTHSPQESLTDLKKMFSQIEQIFSHIIRTRFAASFILMLALPMAAKAQIEPVITIESSPTSIMEGKTARFIISASTSPNQQPEGEHRSDQRRSRPPQQLHAPYYNHHRDLRPGHTDSTNQRFHGESGRRKLGLGKSNDKKGKGMATRSVNMGTRVRASD